MRSARTIQRNEHATDDILIQFLMIHHNLTKDECIQLKRDMKQKYPRFALIPINELKIQLQDKCSITFNPIEYLDFMDEKKSSFMSLFRYTFFNNFNDKKHRNNQLSKTENNYAKRRVVTYIEACLKELMIHTYPAHESIRKLISEVCNLSHTMFQELEKKLKQTGRNKRYYLYLSGLLAVSITIAISLAVAFVSGMLGALAIVLCPMVLLPTILFFVVIIHEKIYKNTDNSNSEFRIIFDAQMQTLCNQAKLSLESIFSKEPVESETESCSSLLKRTLST